MSDDDVAKVAREIVARTFRGDTDTAMLADETERAILQDRVERAIRDAVAAEREACAALAEDYDGPGVSESGYDWQLGDASTTMNDISAAIRARAVEQMEGTKCIKQ